MKNYLTNVFGSDLRALAALRIGCALLIIFDLLERSTDLVAHYTDYGVAPRSLVIENLSSRWYISLHLMSGVWQLQALLFLFAGAAAVALLVGYRTRLATIVSWALFVSLCARNFYLVQGGDLLLRVVLFWAMFLPWGARYSVDSAWREESPHVLPMQYLSWGTAAYVLQILFMYWFTVLLKTGTQWWGEGSAVYYTLNIDYLVSPIGKALLALPYPLLRLATWGVVLFEIVGPALLLLPVRKGWVRLATTVGFVLLHATFLLTMFIGIFPLIGIISMFFFLPALFWDWVARLTSADDAAPKIYYDQDCGFCWRSVRVIKTFFLLPDVTMVGAQTVPAIETEMLERNSWVVVDGKGSRHYGYAALIVVAGVSPMLRPLVPLMNLSSVVWLGERLYRYVAMHRRSICPLPGHSAQIDAHHSYLHPIRNLAIAALIAYVFVLNLATIPNSGVPVSDNFRSLSVITGLDQLWNMFAPFPAKDDGWYFVPGTLRNGRQVDLFRGGKEVSLGKPAYASLEYKNHRWRKYIELMRKRAVLQPVYAGYLCREWNRSHQASEMLDSLEIIYVLEWTQPVSEYSPIERQSLNRFNCFDLNKPPSAKAN